MISRLDRLQGRDIYENTVLAKLNEVIDAVNNIVSVQEKLIDSRFVVETKHEEPEKVNMDIETPVVKMWKEKLDKIERENQAKIDRQIVETLITPADPYSEQRKWIGKLCKFWDYDGEEKWFSVLEYIDKNSPYTYCASGDWWYKHCEPVKPDDDIIYKGE